MKPAIIHEWDISEAEALSLQKELSGKVTHTDDYKEIRFIAGVDVAYSKKDDMLVAAVVILDSKTLEVVESSISEGSEQFPYIPGLFSFREIPPLIEAFEKLNIQPDLIVCDGQGYAHPRRFGLACHLGVIFNKPSIGCGKTRLIGTHGEVGIHRGEKTCLTEGHEIIGNVLRTQDHINPIYVSVGHRISLSSACDWVLKLCPKYRLPETTRQADQLVNKVLSSR
ncbi:deoxyribonuclease V [Vibrio penaeicida]|uniref:deoxyribonuclease V n=1 Tax=Vibrio penaeicida TaxID=104609 RepID=UPI002734EA30|nr:deoxyribonuclease V [Vibrio penaeicida]MDP2571761.1 deoxyribonuclease V [Vibrio penaeicida]